MALRPDNRARLGNQFGEHGVVHTDQRGVHHEDEADGEGNQASFNTRGGGSAGTHPRGDGTPGPLIDPQLESLHHPNDRIAETGTQTQNFRSLSKSD